MVFAVRFVIFLGVFYAAYLGIAGTSAFEYFLVLNAEAAGSVLAILGEDVQVLDRVVRSPTFSVKVVRGCDGLEPVGLFSSAVLAAPVALTNRLAGMLIGSVCLLVINLVRIVTLMLAQIHVPKATDVLHYEIWQAILVVLAAILWVVWIRWTTAGGAKR